MADVAGPATTITVTPLPAPAPPVTPPAPTVDRSIGVVGEELYQQVLPLHGPDRELLAYDLVGAWTHGTREVHELVSDTDAGPGWSKLFDLDRLSGGELRWLAQGRGVRLRQPRAGETVDAWDTYAREAIVAQSAQLRGTVEAQVAAVQATLTGTRWVAYTERVGGDAYAIAVRTKTVETPSPAATLAALIDYDYGQKPAGLLLDFATVSGQTYSAVAGRYASYSALAAAFTSYRAAAEAGP